MRWRNHYSDYNADHAHNANFAYYAGFTCGLPGGLLGREQHSGGAKRYDVQVSEPDERQISR
jgi:hypothetical protein